MSINYAELLTRPEYTFDQAAIHYELQNRRVLITGAGGTIGSAIARGICNSVTQFLGIVGHSELPIFNLARELNKSHVLPAIVDIGSDEMRTLIEKWEPDVIIHAAAHKHVGLMSQQPEAAFQNNTEGTISLAKAAQDAGVERFLFISTDKAAQSASNMGASKRLAECWLLANYPEATIVRFGNVLGSSGSLVEIATKQILNDEPVILRDRRMTRYCITPNEAVGLVLTSGLLLGPGAYVLDMGAPILMEDLLYRLASQLGRAWVLQTSEAGLEEKLYEDLTNPREVLRPTPHEKIFRIVSHLSVGEVSHALGRVREDIKELIPAATSLS